MTGVRSGTVMASHIDGPSYKWAIQSVVSHDTAPIGGHMTLPRHMPLPKLCPPGQTQRWPPLHLRGLTVVPRCFPLADIRPSLRGTGLSLGVSAWPRLCPPHRIPPLLSTPGGAELSSDPLGKVGVGPH